jgi:hypothetical protein
MVILADKIFEIKKTSQKGRGVFACQSFLPGDTIETVPIILIPKEQYSHIEKTIFFHYVFGWKGDDFALALGHGSLYNHSYIPNAIYRKLEDEDMIEFVAWRPIQAGEEILINYNGDPLSKDPLWFPVQE